MLHEYGFTSQKASSHRPKQTDKFISALIIRGESSDLTERRIIDGRVWVSSKLIRCWAVFNMYIIRSQRNAPVSPWASRPNYTFKSLSNFIVICAVKNNQPCDDPRIGTINHLITRLRFSRSWNHHKKTYKLRKQQIRPGNHQSK